MHAGTQGDRRPLEAFTYTYPQAVKMGLLKVLVTLLVRPRMQLVWS